MARAYLAERFFLAIYSTRWVWIISSWDIAIDDIRKTPQTHHGNISAVVVSYDGKLLGLRLYEYDR